MFLNVQVGFISLQNADDDEELRLTSTDDDDNVGELIEETKAAEKGHQSETTETQRSSSIKKKKSKKSRDFKVKDKGKVKGKDKTDSKLAAKRRELEGHISLAKRISERARGRESSPTTSSRDGGDHRKSSSFDSKKGRRTRMVSDDDESSGYPDYKKRLEELRHRAKKEAVERNRKAERDKEEMYDRMINPHLYGPDDHRASRAGGSSGGGGLDAAKMRRVRKGEHYEDVQREFLENELKMRERLERAAALSRFPPPLRDFHHDHPPHPYLRRSDHHHHHQHYSKRPHYEEDPPRFTGESDYYAIDRDRRRSLDRDRRFR